MDSSDDNEFFADFGERALTDAQLATLVERAGSAGDAELRLLVK